MTIQEAFEIIKDEMPYENGVINEALKMVEALWENRYRESLIYGVTALMMTAT